MKVRVGAKVRFATCRHRARAKSNVSGDQVQGVVAGAGVRARVRVGGNIQA